MKIKVIQKPYSEVCALKKPKHQNPKVSLYPLRLLMKLIGSTDLKETNFKANYIGISEFPKEPCLILMNHSSFIDLEIMASIMFPSPFAIVCTSDGFVGKEWLMRHLGCIPTNKFVTDPSLISDISYALKINKTHVLMYPEASYTFDGTATDLPNRFGTLLRMLKVPVIMVTTHGAFLRDPLYNMLQKRKIDVSADIELLFTPDMLKQMKTADIDAVLKEKFSFDGFGWQRDNRIRIDVPFRADGLERILYKCPYCLHEGTNKGSGTSLTCSHCGAITELDEYGVLNRAEGNDAFTHIPDWYRWERGIVREQIQSGEYLLDCDVNILVLRDFGAVYDIGRGHLTHTNDGFTLVSDDGKLNYTQKPQSNYSLYADYYWYELGDMFCIGTNEMLYYCFPDKDANIPAAKARIAAEEMYKLITARKHANGENTL